MSENWPVRLFNKSVLKQNKLRHISAYLGPTDDLSCLDIGSDNGVVSYLLRRRGGRWASADLDEGSVSATRELVGSDVCQIGDSPIPFEESRFDRVVIVDFLEHIRRDGDFVEEMYRVLKPGGVLVINVPHIKNSPLRRLRLALGQTDEKHGHVRPGYTLEAIRRLLGEHFAMEAHTTYSRFFSELVDTLVVQAVYALKNHKEDSKSKKGAVVTGNDLSSYKSGFRLYSLIYPAIWLLSRLDALLFFTSGYMLIVRARSNKQQALQENPVELRRSPANYLELAHV